MITARNTLILLVVSMASVTGLSSQSQAADNLWQGDVSTNWATAANWSLNGATGFVPRGSGGFNQRAIIGTDDQNTGGALAGVAVLNSLLAANNQTIHGLYLGTRERDFTLAGAPFINPAPAEGALTGSLTISGATTVLNNAGTPTLPHSSSGADGRIVVGQDGRGYLTMEGGTLTGLGLVVGGEDVTTGNGTSLVDLRGSSTLTVNGTSQFSRRLRVEGSGVNFSSTGTMRLDSTNSYTAAITNATAHSPLKVTTFGEKAFVGGTLNVEFSGAAATRDPIASLGTKWGLIDVNNLADDAIDGSFSNVGDDGSIAVAGLDAAHSAPLGAIYAVRKRTTATNTLLELSYEQVLILTVNRDTGQMSIRNPYAGQIAIDTYSISSARGSMKNTFAGLGTTTPNAGDWVKPAGNNANVISEVKVPLGDEDAYNLFPVPTIGIGDGYDELGVASNVANFGLDGEDLIFEYGGPGTDDALIRGHIEYIGSKFENNLVLRVNPNTGVARLKNDSLETLVFDGFEITSTGAALSAGGFTAITGGTGTWQTDAEGTTGLSQVNFGGARTLMPQQEVSIGDISSLVTPFATQAAQDGLSMRFILAEGLESSAATGDYNNDGVVDAVDYTVWRNNFGLAATNLENRDPANTATTVDGTHYTDWKANYGSTGGVLPETEFRIGSLFFDTTLAGAGSGGLAVPEPATGVLLLMGVGALVGRRGRRMSQQVISTDDQRPGTETGNVGVRIMARRIAYGALAAMAFVVVAGSTQTADAVTGGIPLVNFDMELPGPPGEKVVAFDALGDPIPGIIPGWTFTGGAGGIGEVLGKGAEDFGGDMEPGDSGTEGSGFAGHGQEMLLSTNDGRAYQIAAGHVIANPALNQQYKIGFDAVDIFTINDVNEDPGFQLTARVFAGAYPGTTLKTLNAIPVEDILGFQHYEILIPRNDPALTPGVIGQSLGIEFDTTSREFNAGVTKSWAGIDNVVMEITGILPGDLNGDGVVNLTDAANLTPNLQASTPFEAMGELTGDNIVNLNDFRALKTLIAAGSGSGGGGLAGGPSVPEPASGMLALFGLMGVALAAARRRFGAKAVKLLAVAAVSAAALEASPAAAELLAYDPFLIGANPGAGEYIETTFTMDDPPVAVNPLAGQNPTIGPGSFFSGPWVIGSEGQVVQATGLSYLGTPSQGGSVNGFGRTDRFFATPWDDTTVGTYYLGLQVNFGNAPVGENMGYRGIEFYPPNETPGENRIGDIGYNQFDPSPFPGQQQAATAKMHFAFQRGFPVAEQLIQPAPQSFNDDGLTHLLVLKFVLSADDASDTVSLYFDPKTPIEPSAPTNQISGIDFALGGIGAASFANGLGATTVLDEIRVGTMFADVLPPDLPIPGDVNDDDIVDILDYNIIIANMNIPGGQALEDGDVTGDGKVSIADFRFWKERRTDVPGAGAGGLAGGASGVPEPSSLVLALMLSAFAHALSRPARRAIQKG
jgi:hypothetical protein